MPSQFPPHQRPPPLRSNGPSPGAPSTVQHAVPARADHSTRDVCASETTVSSLARCHFKIDDKARTISGITRAGLLISPLAGWRLAALSAIFALPGGATTARFRFLLGPAPERLRPVARAGARREAIRENFRPSGSWGNGSSRCRRSGCAAGRAAAAGQACHCRGPPSLGGRRELLARLLPEAVALVHRRRWVMGLAISASVGGETCTGDICLA